MPSLHPQHQEVPAEESPSAEQGMACMEIWGGNVAADTAVSTPGIDAFVYSKPYHQANEQSGGGDIHYVSLCASGRLARFAVADVSGHGEMVSGLATSLRGMMRRHINTPNQSRFATDLNAAFANESAEGRFATALLATYWTPTDHLIICNAGHPRPLWYRAAEKRWHLMTEELGVHADQANDTGIRNLPLGIIDPTDYTQSAYPLARGDLVLIYTDSLSEATAPDGTLLGEHGLIRICEQLDPTRPDVFIPALLDGVRAYRGGLEPDDDVTALLLHHNASGVPRYSLRERAAMIGRLLGIGG
jgi:sigma-B regulation protein RsbU (phosphoserine phosphatase)